MQASDTSSSAHHGYRARANMQRSSTGDHRPLNKLVERGRSILKTNDMFSHSPNPDIINMQDLQDILMKENERRNDTKSAAHQDRIIINISGIRFETFKSTLEIYPNTLLGNAKRRKYYYDTVQNEYFFDRHRLSFEAILYYYQSNGRLRRPDFVPIDTFLEEITFFDMAKCVHVLSLIAILVATVALAFESLPEYVNLANNACKEEYRQHNITAVDNSTDTHHTQTMGSICLAYFLSPFNLIQTICVSFFTLELILRIISMPSICEFIKNIMNWIDILAIVPFYITIGAELIGGRNDGHATAYTGLQLLRVLRFARVFKFYRIFKNIKPIRVLAETFKESIPDFVILVAILALLAFLFGAAVYFAESTNSTSAFDSIPKATYWGVITITSVGYGDIAPITPAGRVIPCLCALSGAGTIAMLVSVLVDRYQRVYTRKLYIKSEKVDFDECLIEDKDDLESEPLYRFQDHRVDNVDVRKKQQGTPRIYVENDAPAGQNNEEETSNSSPPLLDLIRRNSNRVHVIISYDDGDKNEISPNLLDKITSVASEKQFTSSNMAVNVISDAPLSQSFSSHAQFDCHSNDKNWNDDIDLWANTTHITGNDRNSRRAVPRSPRTIATDQHVHTVKMGEE